MAKSKQSAVLPGQFLLAAVCALAAFYAAGLVYEMDFAPAGCCGLAWPARDPVAVERLAAGGDPKGQNAAVQRDAALAVLSARPAEPVAWVRLAYADWLAHGGLVTQTAADALDRSYLMAPYQRVAPLRISFALANWSQLRPETRKYVLKEIGLAHSEVAAGEGQRWIEVQTAVRQTQLDPSGRMTAALLGLF